MELTVMIKSAAMMLANHVISEMNTRSYASARPHITPEDIDVSPDPWSFTPWKMVRTASIKEFKL